MPKHSVFTICAKNYIGLAQILEKSLKTYNKNISFYIFVAGEISVEEENEMPNNVFECKKILNGHIDEVKLEEMAFKYNLTEFCTSVKPFCFQYLFDNLNSDKCIYLDPDILTLSSFQEIFDMLDVHKIILTPHITSIETIYKGARSEKGLLSTGVFNLGFLALRASAQVSDMLSWWGERLKMQCFIDALDSYFTDQRWMDFLPCFFSYPDLLVTHHLGLNLAPWNFFERELFKIDDCWHVRYRAGKQQDLENLASYTLVFVHFSGYDYKSLLKGNIIQNNITGLVNYPDIDEICELYAKYIKTEAETFNKYINLPYTYNNFKNGEFISHFVRRIFRSLIEEGEAIVKPFSTIDNSFYNRLKKRGLIIKSTEQAVDKLNKSTMADAAAKLKVVNKLMRLTHKIIGIKYYTLILRLMRPYSRIENHIHLIDKKYDDKLM